MKKDVTLSDNIDELREDILMLLLAIEGKNKELTDVKETLSAVQADFKNVMNSSKSAADKVISFTLYYLFISAYKY